MNTFLTSNEAKWKLIRTIVQGVISVVATSLPDILGLFHIDPTLRAILIPMIMAVLSPIMAYMGDAEEEKSAELALQEENESLYIAEEDNLNEENDEEVDDDE